MKDFAKHKFNELGFSLFVKRARISQAKHVRVRPKLDRCGLVREFGVSDERISTEAMQDIVQCPGTTAVLATGVLAARRPAVRHVRCGGG